MIAAALLIGIWVSTSFAEQQVYMITRIQMLFDENLTESRRTSQRSTLARAGVDIFLKNPLGIGTGSFRDQVAETSYLQSNRPAHSAWIKTLAENGVPGILLMAFFIGSFALAGFHKHQDGLLLFGVFITLTLASAFVAKEFQGKSLWFLVASGIAVLHAQQMQEYISRKMKSHEVDHRGASDGDSLWSQKKIICVLHSLLAAWEKAGQRNNLSTCSGHSSSWKRRSSFSLLHRESSTNKL
jgi:hypothetical protein